MAEYFHHQIIRNNVVAFGNIFRDIHIKRKEGSTVLSEIRVPISYSNKSAFIERVRIRGNDPTNIKDVVSTTVPRFAFEINSLDYDKDTKLNRLHKLNLFSDILIDGMLDSNEILGDISLDQIEEFTKDRLVSLYTPVPYMINFSLYLLTNRHEDHHQIVEMIVPRFTPHLMLPVIYEFGPILKDTGLQYKGRVRATIDQPLILEGMRTQELNDTTFDDATLFFTEFKFNMRSHFFREIHNEALIKKFTLNFQVANEIATPAPISTNYFTTNIPFTGVVNLDRWYQYFAYDSWQDTTDLNTSDIVEHDTL